MYKTIEAKLNAQNEELMQRAKVIEELKTSLSIFIDKYNKLKVDLEKERQYGIQISLGLKNSQRAKKKGKGFPPLRITHFSSYYPRCVVRKKTATNPKSEVELKELKEKFEKFKSEKNKNENEWNLNLNKLKGELDESQKKLLSCQEELSHERKDKDKINDIIKGYLSSIETLKEEKNKKTNEISQLNDKMKEILNEKTKICEQIQSLKKESDEIDYAMNLRFIGNFLGKKTLFLLFITFILISISLTLGEKSAKEQAVFYKINNREDIVGIVIYGDKIIAKGFNFRVLVELPCNPL